MPTGWRSTTSVPRPRLSVGSDGGGFGIRPNEGSPRRSGGESPLGWHVAKHRGRRLCQGTPATVSPTVADPSTEMRGTGRGWTCATACWTAPRGVEPADRSLSMVHGNPSRQRCRGAARSRRCGRRAGSARPRGSSGAWPGCRQTDECPLRPRRVFGRRIARRGLRSRQPEHGVRSGRTVRGDPAVLGQPDQRRQHVALGGRQEPGVDIGVDPAREAANGRRTGRERCRDL